MTARLWAEEDDWEPMRSNGALYGSLGHRALARFAPVATVIIRVVSAGGHEW
ncbi:hypothetical protein JL107_16885 [Nakamurella flavida]|uniref:Uncharacterized protein n=1 Tax=Nakamurella flavida TaxID=363630 RepID=A0A939C3X0_9ACTN|nr:hypothetical protein [Nakamurella flavida]MBM9478125.1 hypothetical protein [Nakamurella flavida]MDP9778653.1 hypothetical protein [Nakamurella flavida]